MLSLSLSFEDFLANLSIKIYNGSDLQETFGDSAMVETILSHFG